jgi:hypothetical protein
MVEEPDPDTAWLAELTMHLPDDPDAGQQEAGSAAWSGEPAQLEEDESEGANLEIDSMPDWLKSSWDEETSEEEDETEVEASLPSLPDWLTDADDQDAADEEAASDDLDWLSSLRQSETLQHRA